MIADRTAPKRKQAARVYATSRRIASGTHREKSSANPEAFDKGVVAQLPSAFMLIATLCDESVSMEASH